MKYLILFSCEGVLRFPLSESCDVKISTLKEWMTWVYAKVYWGFFSLVNKKKLSGEDRAPEISKIA